MRNGRGMKAYAIDHERVEEYLLKKMDLIRSGEDRPLQIRLGNGAVIQFRCKRLLNGGHLLSYGNVSELAREADALERLGLPRWLDRIEQPAEFYDTRRHGMVAVQQVWAAAGLADDRHRFFQVGQRPVRPRCRRRSHQDGRRLIAKA
jgi:hypothetical protein